jgi:hypothetical protein
MATYDVFLSYARRDAREVAEVIARRLTDRGLRIFLDDALVVGEPLAHRLENALTHARAVVVLLSPAAASSRWVHEETAFALRRQQTIIPVVLDRNALDSPLGSLLGDRQYIDCTDVNPSQAADRVAACLEGGMFHEARRRRLRMSFFLMLAALVVSWTLVAALWQRSRPLADRLRAGSASKKESGANLARADLTGVNVEAFDFTDAVLAGAKLTRIRCSSARFDRAVMSEAHMDHAMARDASFDGASLLAADLRRADLTSASLRNADLRLADLRGALLSSAKLEGARLEGAIFDRATRWPAAFDPQKQGARSVNASP